MGKKRTPGNYMPTLGCQDDEESRNLLIAKVLFVVGNIPTCGLLITMNEIIKSCQANIYQGMIDFGAAVLGAAGGFALNYFLILEALDLSLSSVYGALIVAGCMAFGSAIFARGYNWAYEQIVYRPTKEELANIEPNLASVKDHCGEIHKLSGITTLFFSGDNRDQISYKNTVDNARNSLGA